jgi:hypothetical protein
MTEESLLPRAAGTITIIKALTKNLTYFMHPASAILFPKMKRKALKYISHIVGL